MLGKPKRERRYVKVKTYIYNFIFKTSKWKRKNVILRDKEQILPPPKFMSKQCAFQKRNVFLNFFKF